MQKVTFAYKTNEKTTFSLPKCSRRLPRYLAGLGWLGWGCSPGLLSRIALLDCSPGLLSWVALPDFSPGLLSLIALLDCSSWTGFLDCSPGLLSWIALLDCSPGLLSWAGPAGWASWFCYCLLDQIQIDVPSATSARGLGDRECKRKKNNRESISNGCKRS